MSIIKQIFTDHFNDVVDSGISIRPAVFDNHCGKFKMVPFSCKSRFCNSCGNMYSMKRSSAMSFKLIRTSHRHCVFTIPEELRLFFRKDRSLLNCLFRAVADAILFMFRKLNKSENFTPGFICVLPSSQI